MKKLLCIAMICMIAILSFGCSENKPERLLDKKATEEDILALSLEAQLLLEDWSSPEEISPDCFFQYYEALVVHGYVSEKEDEAEIDRKIVEDVLLSYFTVDPQQIRKSSCYKEENKSYEIGGIGNVLDYQVDEIKQSGEQTQINYTLFSFDQFRQSGTLTIERKDEYRYRFLSHQIDKSADVIHPDLKK